MSHPPHDHGLCSMAATFFESTVQGEKSVHGSVISARRSAVGSF